MVDDWRELFRALTVGNDAGATVKVNGVTVASGSASGPITLSVGSNTITVLVTAADTTTTKTYSIALTRAASGNADLSNLTISSGTLVPAFASGTVSYTAAVANSVASITVTPTLADAGATVKVNGVTVASGSASGPIALAVGSNAITVVVTAADATTTKTYSIAVTRAASGNADLSNLTLSSGTLVPVFASGTLSYSAAVANNVTSITVTPTVADAGATVKVNGVTVASGSASGPITLAVGSNTITVVVTAADATTTKTYTIAVTRAASGNADLSNLTISSGTLVPAFASGTVSYTAAVANNVASITVTPTVADVGATVKVNGVTVISGSASGPITLSVGSNTITVLVTAADTTTTKTYSIAVTRAASGNADLSNLTLSSGTLTPVFASATLSYTATVANNVSSITVTPTVADAGATVKVNGVTVASGSASGPITLAVGSNTITVVVTAADTTTTKTYSIAVTRAASGNADLSNLTISSGTLVPAFASATLSYTAAVANNVTSITVTPTVADAGATVKVNGVTVASGSASGPIALSVGSNTITVLVTAADTTTTKTYSIAVTRAASGNANLSNLTLSSGTLTPAFASAILSYTAGVANSVTSITVTPTVADAGATVKVNGVTVASGSASGPIALSVGSNTITVVVTAADGVTTKTYTIAVTRAASGNAPTVVSVLRADPSPTMADSVLYTLTFSEPITGLTASNLSLTTAGGLTAATVQAVNGSDTTWTVAVDTGRGTGTLQLNVANGTGIVNASGDTLTGTPFSGETYTIDKGGTVLGAGEGQPDPSFGDGGYALFSLSQSVASPGAIAVLTNGKILAAGGSECDAVTGTNCTLQLAQYLADGTPDTATFPPDGQVHTSVSGINPELSALIANSDGTFFVAGSRDDGSGTVPFVAKFASHGTLVSNYGTSGLARLSSLPLGSTITGAAVDGSGRVIVAGTTLDAGAAGSDLFVARLTTAGVLDGKFGNGGVAVFGISDTGSNDDLGTDVAVQPNGRIVIGGHTMGTSGFDFLLLRLSSNGAKDTTFGSAGVATTHFAGTGDNAGRKLALQPDGKIVLVGPVDVGGSNQCGVARFNSDGTLDMTLGTSANGQVLIPLGQGCLDVTLQPDGKLVVTAQDRGADVTYATFVRMLANGSLDAEFGDDGVQDISSYTKPTPVAVTKSGNLVSGLVKEDPADGIRKAYVVQLGSGLAAATTTAITSISPSPALTGQAYAVNVTVRASTTPTGTVNVSDGHGATCTITLASGGGSCALISTTSGSKTITATYGGSSSYRASAATKAQMVNAASTATTLAVSGNPVPAGTAVTLTATVTATSPGATTPVGTVTFKDGGATLGTGSLNGAGVATLTFTPAAGTYKVTASFAGDANYFKTSKSATVSLSVQSQVPGCATAADSLTFKDKEVRWKITNGTDSKLTIAEIMIGTTIPWPSANRALDQVKLDAEVIAGKKVDFPCCSADITTFDKDVNKRSIDHNKSKTLRFKFREQAVATATDYQIEVLFTNGCTIHFP